ncbi:MAG: ArsA family ATPase [Pseudobdellovibrionaceae bacterium]
MKKNFFGDTKILICIGSGGVGKTTVAASLGILAAKQGLRVLVLTIDPAKMLATTLGIANSTEITEVPGQNYPGKVYASVIDHQKTFEEFVMRAAKKSPAAVKILQNKLFKQLSTQLSHSQDFTSLEKLNTCAESGEFDLIILDTPPMKHAVDFLNAPQKLAALFSEGMTKWFRDPRGEKSSLIMNLFTQGTRRVLKILENLTGAEFVDQLTDFFQIIQSWQSELYQRTMNAQKLLMDSKTRFCLVSNFDEVKMIEAQNYAKEIKKSGFQLGYLILNRAFPSQIDLSLSAAQKDLKNPKFAAMVQKYEKIYAYYAGKEKIYAHLVQKMGQDLLCIKLADYQSRSDLAMLEQLADEVQGELDSQFSTSS